MIHKDFQQLGARVYLMLRTKFALLLVSLKPCGHWMGVENLTKIGYYHRPIISNSVPPSPF